MEVEKEVGKSEAQAKAGNDTPLLRVEGLKKYFEIRGGLFGSQATVKAMDGVDLTLQEGESVGLVGESGCGKITVGRTILGLIPPTEGKVFFQGRDVSSVYDFNRWLKDQAAADGRVLMKAVGLCPEQRRTSPGRYWKRTPGGRHVRAPAG